MPVLPKGRHRLMRHRLMQHRLMQHRLPIKGRRAAGFALGQQGGVQRDDDQARCRRLRGPPRVGAFASGD